MQPLIVTKPFPACILRSGDPARDHRRIDVAETFLRNMPPIQDMVDASGKKLLVVFKQHKDEDNG